MTKGRKAGDTMGRAGGRSAVWDGRLGPRMQRATLRTAVDVRPVLLHVFAEGMPSDVVLQVMKRTGRKPLCRPVFSNYDELRSKPLAVQRARAKVLWYLDDCCLTFMLKPGPGGVMWRVVKVGDREEPPPVDQRPAVPGQGMPAGDEGADDRGSGD